MAKVFRTTIILATALASRCQGFVVGPAVRAAPPLPRRRMMDRSVLPIMMGSSSAAADASAAAPEESSPSTDRIVVALTREAGKNAKLRKALTSHPALEALTASGLEIEAIEIPCVEHAPGPDGEELVDVVRDGRLDGYDYVVLTSPEAAKVFAEAVEAGLSDRAGEGGDEYAGDGAGPVAILGEDSGPTGSGSVRIAAVGKATAAALDRLEVGVDFVPSRANGETLAAELPPIRGSAENEGDGDVDAATGTTRVLYPASARAADTVREGLESRRDDGAKFEVTRLDTYDTVGTTFTPSQLGSIESVCVACFGSPSSVDAWLRNVDEAGGFVSMSEEEKRQLGPRGNGNVRAACIGGTTAKACLESGRWHATDIYYPRDNPGVEGWAASVVQAVGDVAEGKFWS